MAGGGEWMRIKVSDGKWGWIIVNVGESMRMKVYEGKWGWMDEFQFFCIVLVERSWGIQRNVRTKERSSKRFARENGAPEGVPYLRKIQSKNKSVCENAVTGIWGSCTLLVMGSCASWVATVVICVLKCFSRFVVCVHVRNDSRISLPL